MRNERNDYVLTTKGYLRDYNELRAMVTAWKNERADIAAELSSFPVAISKYGDEPGGGTNELTTVERQAYQREKERGRLEVLNHDIAVAEKLLHRIDDGILCMGEDGKLLRAHYIEKKSWYELAEDDICSYGAVRQRGSRCIKTLAKILFGLQAWPPYQMVLFA